ncbi:MAG: YdhR family protein [Thainema sp.]
MTTQMIKITFNYDCSETKLQTIFAAVAPAIAAFPGLVWKVWIINEVRQEAGGIYCFESFDALERYLSSPIMAALEAKSIVSNLRIEPFTAIEPLSALTRGPIPVTAM